MSDPKAGPYLMLTPAGALHAFAQAQPDAQAQALQSLLPQGPAWAQADWLQAHPEQADTLAHALDATWVQTTTRQLQAPDSSLDNYLPHAIAGLSGSRKAALASDQGFCLAHVGYSAEEAETLSVVAADFYSFVQRQQQRGWSVSGRAVSFFTDISLLMPSTSLMLFWVDGTGYWLILGDEPLLNNTALVELIWGIRLASHKFAATSAR